MNLWSHLSNAHHIDWVIGSMKWRTRNWYDARNRAWPAALDVGWSETRTIVHHLANNAAGSAAYNTVFMEIQNATRNSAWGVSMNAIDWNAIWPSACIAAWSAIQALIAYDDCDQYLAITYEQLLAYAVLSEKPQTILLLPMKWVQEHESLVTAT